MPTGKKKKTLLKSKHLNKNNSEKEESEKDNSENKNKRHDDWEKEEGTI